MTAIKWMSRMICHTLSMAVVNRSVAFAFSLLFFLLLAALIISAQVAAPWIYTLF